MQAPANMARQQENLGWYQGVVSTGVTWEKFRHGHRSLVHAISDRVMCAAVTHCLELFLGTLWCGLEPWTVSVFFLPSVSPKERNIAFKGCIFWKKWVHERVDALVPTWVSFTGHKVALVLFWICKDHIKFFPDGPSGSGQYSESLRTVTSQAADSLCWCPYLFLQHLPLGSVNYLFFFFHNWWQVTG